MRSGAPLVAAASLLLAPSLLAPLEAEGIAQITRSRAQREYHASHGRAGLQAANRAQSLRTTFEASGIRVHDPARPDAPELLSLSLTGIGRRDALAVIEPGEVTSSGARVEIRREGLVEWYLNSASGLEQGFTLAERPAGDGPLVLELALRGATATQGGEALSLVSASGRRLHYGGLVAVDAAGLEIVARLSVPDPAHMRIEVEDADAAYPLVIDPLLTNTPDGELDPIAPNSGLSHVTFIGDVNGDGYDDVMAGTHYGYVFLGSAPGIASSGFENAATELRGFAGGGKNMAGAGDVNGDGYDDVLMGFDHGLYGGWAEIWMGSPSGIVTSTHTEIWSGLMNDGYTYGGPTCVAGVGDVNGDGYDDVILTTYRSNVPYTSQAVAAIFHGSAAGISGYIGLPDTLIVFSLGYGLRCAGAGDVNGDGYDDVILGLTGYGDPYGTGPGAAMVFHGSASGIASGDHGDTLLTVEGYSGEFGTSVAGAGDVNGDGFDDVIVSDPYFGGGAAFVYLGSASGIPDSSSYWSPTAIMIEPDLSTLGLGYFASSVAGAGDVNGDGYDDVIVGAPWADAGEEREGAAFVFLGSATGIAAGSSDNAYARLESNQAFAYFGVDVAGGGDVNGDGLADVLIAADLYDVGEAAEGAAFVYLGQADIDGDHAPDSTDNCLSQMNPSQLDADGDGFGNACDADFDQSGVSGISDYGTFRSCYGQAVPASAGPAADPTCAESDMNGDLVVGVADYGLFRGAFGSAPGPGSAR